MMGKFLSWLQERIKYWTKPAAPATISGILSDLPRSRSDLVVENALLRQQLIVLNRQIKRPQLTNRDRFRLVFLSHFTKLWKQSLHIVQPDTLLRWHRELFRFYCRRKSQGKPKVSSDTISLIQEMAKENQLWGADPWRIAKTRDGSEQANYPEIPAERQEGAFIEPNLGDFLEESSQKHLGM